MAKISERTLRGWRREALKGIDYNLYDCEGVHIKGLINYSKDLQQKVCAMTQQLLDQYLLENKEKKQ